MDLTQLQQFMIRTVIEKGDKKMLNEMYSLFEPEKAIKLRTAAKYYQESIIPTEEMIRKMIKEGGIESFKKSLNRTTIRKCLPIYAILYTTEFSHLIPLNYHVFTLQKILSGKFNDQIKSEELSIIFSLDKNILSNIYDKMTIKNLEYIHSLLQKSTNFKCNNELLEHKIFDEKIKLLIFNKKIIEKKFHMKNLIY